MNAQELETTHFDEIYKEILAEKAEFHRSLGLSPVGIVSGRQIAERLWKKHRVAYHKEASVVRQKLQEWWKSYPQRQNPRIHKIIGGLAVHLSTGIYVDYFFFERSGYTCQNLIIVYQDQKQFNDLPFC